MAGVDTNIDGEARAQSGIRIGYLQQEPQLDETHTVRQAVMQGLGVAFKQLARFNEISEKFAEPMSDDEMNALLEEQAKLQDAIDASSGWEVERQLDIAADALRLPDWDAIIASSPAARSAAWRCASSCCPRRTCCCWTNPPTTSTPNPWRGWNVTSRNTPAP